MKLDHMGVLKRAWRILWSYRVLWVFGIILTLTSGGGGSSSGANSARYSGDGSGAFRFDAPPDIQRELGEMGEGLGELFEQIFSTGVVPAGIIALGVGLACLGLVAIVISIIARFVAENALIKLVDDYEETGKQRSLKEGLKMGWSRAAFRQWLINLVITLPLVIGILVALALSLAPLLAWTTGRTTVGIFGTVASIGLFFLVILAAIAVGTIAGIVEKLAYRAASLEDLGVFPSIGRGIQLLRKNLMDIGLLWLIMFGIGLGYAVLMIPVILLTLAIAAVAGGLLFLGISGATGLLFGGVVRWIIAGIIGGFVFFLVLFVPFAFTGGVYEVYKSSVWTLAYRELIALEALGDKELPEADPKSMEPPDTTDTTDTAELLE